jgi:signal peptidase I
MTAARKIGKFFLNVVIYFAIVGALLYGLPRFLSWKLETPYPMAAITSGSMWPALKQGDLVFIQGVKGKEELHEGDVVVWQNANGFTIHRVVELREDTLVTKGDANFSEDAPVSYDDVIGKTVEIFGRHARLPYLGMVSVYAGRN